MASKRFKIKFSLPSFQLCRSKRPILPAITYFSPVNPKSSDISFPTFPDPPPSTPNYSTNFISLNSHKIHNSPTSSDFDHKSPVQQLKSEISKENKNRNKSKSKSKVCASISSGEYGVWFSSEDEDETKTTFSSSRSFDSSLETIKESPNEDMKNKKKSKTNLRVRRLRRYVSYSCKTASSDSESDLPRKKKKSSGKVKESFAIVKKSNDPYEDFKRSMLEMILEKQIFEANDLEQLLQCFLALNSKQYHAVIVQAFSEIWTDLFV